MYKHILVAIDLSPRSCNALKHAIKLAHLFNSKITLADIENSYFIYPLTAKELVIECEKWIPNQTAEQQKATREVPCIRYIQSVINTYQTLQLDHSKSLGDLCIPELLNIKRLLNNNESKIKF